jgi:hypothetical protein
LKPLFANSLEFEIKKSTVKTGVMGNKWVLGNKLGHLLHYGFYRWSGGKHFVGNAGVAFNKAGNSHSWIHEALISVNDGIVFNHNGSDFNGSVAIAWR